MKFFEKTLTVKTDSIFNFVCSSLNALVFAPVRLVQEVSKKAVFLSKKKIDLMLFTSVMIGLAFTIAITVIKQVSGTFSFVLGRLPLFIMIIGNAVLVFIYVAFNTVHLIVYDELTEDVMKSELGIRNKSQNAKSVQQGNSPDVINNDENLINPNAVTKWINENDYFVPKPNPEILESEEVRNYQNRIKAGIGDLETFKTESEKYSDAELVLLRQKLDCITSSSKYINKDFTENIMARVDEDEMLNLMNEVIDLPENFTLNI